MIIRQANCLDVSTLTELNKECLPVYYSQFQHLYNILSPYHLVLVVEAKNKLIGYLIGEHNDKNFHILSIGVQEKYRSKGIGKHLLDYLTNNLPDCNNITLYVHDINDKGINFYIKNNFKKVEHIKNYYEGSFESPSYGAYLMKRII
ncbi:MAG: GNAT family N-acetyltransferase [Nitrososphaeraceae archaeon]|nr:GNAT family N-acetyltransferase [Nitrososphaeraceae archaeon]